MLRWTAAVDPALGLVADHSIEPALPSAELTTAQLECLVGVLSDPPYQLEAGDEPATPTRVGIVIEF
jgi:hypothetical protein